ncbi:MAG: glycosyltransferase [Fibrobacter sp.]|uniref:glycosyltransferase n=1 Tax=Fibrobacter sp. TaxID=35828 RepID=UPI002A908D49|nr:glycosyltransferase [Fibrobacter sp.]MDY6263405.1 glycosyltransferase [Fibrobacter sp.]
MTNTKKISIALATYNGEKYLSELLDSLLTQTVLPDEIVVSDDCSKDNTIQILRDYSKKLPIKVLCNESNLGVNKNFEKAVKMCSGDYILICDQDDVWLPNNIEKKICILEKMPQHLPMLVFSQSIVTDKNLRILQKRKLSKDIVDWRLLLTKHGQGTTMAFNRMLCNVLPKQWPNDFNIFPYDYYIYLTALLTGNVYTSKDALMFYRTHDNNASLKVSKFKNILKQIFPTYKLYQDRISVEMMNNMKWLLSAIDEKKIIAERKDCFEAISKCNNEKKIDWIRFLNIENVPRSIKLRSLLGTMAFFFKDL